MNEIDKKCYKYNALILLFVFLLYFILRYCGAILVDSAYKQQSFDLFNSLIQFQHKYDLSHYLELFYEMLNLFFLILFFCWLLVNFLFAVILSYSRSRYDLAALFFSLLFSTLVASVFVFNSSSRIFSTHGFFHAGIVYQIINHGIPPLNPLFDGDALHYPWGIHFIGALVCKVFNCSPFWSFAFFNITSGFFVVFLVYKTAMILTGNSKTSFYSSIVSVFYYVPFAGIISTVSGIELEMRLSPFTAKFGNVNGVPLGMVFICLSFFLIARMKDKIDFKNSFLLVVSIVLGSFIYFPIMVSAYLSVIGFSILKIIQKRSVINILYAPLIIASCSLLIYPYYRVLTQNIASSMDILSWPFVASNSIKIAIYSWSIFPIIYLLRKRIAEKEILLQLFMVLIISLGYLSIHLPSNNEYKILCHLVPLLSILLCVAVNEIGVKIKPIFSCMLIIVVVFPGMVEFQKRIMLGCNGVMGFVNGYFFYHDNGTRIVSANINIQKAYDWVVENTTSDSVLVSSSVEASIFCQRSLFVGFDSREGVAQNGFGLSMDKFLFDICKCDEHEVELRKEMSKKIYRGDFNFDELQIARLKEYKGRIYIFANQEECKTLMASTGVSCLYKAAGNECGVFAIKDL